MAISATLSILLVMVTIYMNFGTEWLLESVENMLRGEGPDNLLGSNTSPSSELLVTWTRSDQERLEKVYDENPGKDWEFLCSFFPTTSKEEVKKRLLKLELYRSMTAEVKRESLDLVKKEISDFEVEISGPCAKIKEVIHRNRND